MSSLRPALPRVLSPRAGGTVLLLFALAVAAGCTQPVKVKGGWADGAVRTQTYRNLLVVGLSPDYNQRCTFEWMLTPHLRTCAPAGPQAKSSCASMKPDEPLTRENIERLVREQGADAVLVTKLIASQSSAKEGGSRDTRGSAQYKATGIGFDEGYWGGYGYGLPVVYAEFQTAPSILSLKRTVVIGSALFETSTAKPVYQLQTTAKNQQSRDEVLGEISPEIAGQLRSAGLIP